MNKFRLKQARKTKACKAELLESVLQKGKFETYLDLAHFIVGLSSSQMQRLGQLHIHWMAFGMNKTPAEVLQAADPVKLRVSKDLNPAGELVP